MADELIELGRRKKATRKRVCVKPIKVKGGWILSEYDIAKRKHKNYIAAPCKRTKSRKKALVIVTKRAAEDYARRCKISQCRTG